MYFFFLEVFKKFKDTMFDKHKLDLNWFIPTPTLAMAAVLLKWEKI